MTTNDEPADEVDTPGVYDEISKPAADTPIWRYMDLSQYVSMLVEQALFFPRASVLEDQFEGSYSKPTVQQRRDALEDAIPSDLEGVSPSEIDQRMEQVTRMLRNHTYVSSWHENEGESAAMWKLYLETGQGVAIRSTVGALEKSITELDELFLVLGRVRYIDFKTESMPQGNAAWPYFFKRISFQHEREVRAVIVALEEAAHGKDGTETTRPDTHTDFGRYVSVRPDTLIDAVHIAPTAPEWHRRLLQRVNGEFGLELDPKKTELDEDPLF